MSEIGLRRRQDSVEIGDGGSLAAVESTLYLVYQHIAAPPLLNRLLDVPLALGGRFDFVEQYTIMKPRYLCRRRLHKWLIGVGFGKCAHIFEVARRKPLHLWKLVTQIAREALYDLCAPALRLLPGEDVAPDLPVEQREFAIDGQRRANLRLSYALFQAAQEIVVALWCEIARHEMFPSSETLLASSDIHALVDAQGNAVSGCHVPNDVGA